ncbi:amidohydrolase [[Muricauda] lutisoli]|uniref:Amidohydrolase n=1 Tax=[Muricauda] lutisoli TaxID=2816035 RepID=A0ABS3ETJ4_9FLAO|nr:amidohydrolase [[Muricauda] lutisoli]MBO0329568.1 amidohydrolase [[Muricauda] lutisoli]
MIEKEILELRHKLHTNPELSNEEYKTAEIIKKFIAQHHPTEIIEGIGGAGLAAIYKFPKQGKTITFRCELDALPIDETNKLEYKSQKKGISHKCGHDGHMAIVASIAHWLAQKPVDSGTVILLFQPAEETGEGAKRIIEDQKFKSLHTNYIFALHNIPKEPRHRIILMNSGFSAEVQSLIIKVKGKESHASEPENGINPAMGLSDMIQKIAQLNVSDPSNANFAILTPVHINMGQKSYGISPANGELHYTLRTWSTLKMDRLKSNLILLLETIAKKHNLILELEWLEYFPASMVDKESNAFVRKAAEANNFTLTERKTPFKFGEDFGWFSKTYKTAMFGVGAGVSTPALHNADYDFPDDIIPTGFSMFKSIVLNVLKEK